MNALVKTPSVCVINALVCCSKLLWAEKNISNLSVRCHLFDFMLSLHGTKLKWFFYSGCLVSLDAAFFSSSEYHYSYDRFDVFCSDKEENGKYSFIFAWCFEIRHNMPTDMSICINVCKYNWFIWVYLRTIVNIPCRQTETGKRGIFILKVKTQTCRDGT